MEVKYEIQKDGENIIYVNVQAINSTNINQRCDINISRTSPIIKDASQYVFSIVRFKIPTQLHPLFFFPSNSSSLENVYFFTNYSSGGVKTPFSMSFLNTSR